MSDHQMPEAPMPPAAEEVLRDPELTEQERQNVKMVIGFRALPFAERSKYTIEGFKPSRFGMAGMAELQTSPGPGYSGASIPDREDEILDIIAHGDRVWATWLIRGTHQGPLYGIAPTGRKIEVLEVGQWRITDGLISEAWFFVDELAMLRQLDAWPPSPAPAEPTAEPGSAKD
jgi:hypothetical protein